jgi:hypothetical protein
MRQEDIYAAAGDLNPSHLVISIDWFTPLLIMLATSED